ncbi:MAG: gliding motility-associated C-terminal domain-containing protein [Chitinophagales bacterium]|nr:gliding motility-associated C-terminal domain-containing protein [Chitinophagales bacterium]
MHAQTYFQKKLGGLAEDTGYSVQIDYDGNYLIIGTTQNVGAGGRDILLLKTDLNGNILLTKTYGDDGENYPSAIIRTNDLGYVIIGMLYTDLGQKEIHLIKLDSGYQVEWSKYYGGFQEERGLVIYQTPDNGYIIGGSTMSYGAGGKDIYIIKTTETGAIVWQQIMGGSLDDTNLDIKPIADGYILANAVSSYGNGSYDINVMKLNLSGNIIWSKLIGGPNSDNPTAIQTTANGDIIVGGHTLNWGVGDWDIMLTRLTTDGDLVWCKVYGNNGIDFIRQMITTNDGNYMIFGYGTQYAFGSDDIYIAKMTPDGDILWAKSYGSEIQDWNPFHGSIPIAEDSEGSLIFTGEKNDGINRDILFVKTSQTAENAICDEAALNFIFTAVTPNIIDLTPNVVVAGTIADITIMSGTYDDISVYVPNCDDNNCTTADSYDASICTCLNTPIAPPNCDDNNCTTADSYDASICTCLNTPIAPPNCDDNNCTTADSYDASICTCLNTPIAPPNCDDNNCNTTDSYDASICTCLNTPIAPPNCDDNDPNTIDSYDFQTCLCVRTSLINNLIPNAFSPNHDGVNDELRVIGLGISTMNLKIFNRWGQIVFSSDTQNVGWDGTYKGRMQEIGVYVYVLTYTTADQPNVSQQKKGNITLLY